MKNIKLAYLLPKHTWGEPHNRMRSTSLSVISSFVRS
jgi:hypothetical protein